MTLSDFINLVLAVAAVIGIFFSISSNHEVKLQRELQHFPCIRLSVREEKVTLSSTELYLVIKNIGNGIAQNVQRYSAHSISDQLFDGTGLGKIEMGMLSPGEEIEIQLEDSMHSTKALLSLGTKPYLHCLITYEDIFRNLFYTNFHLKSAETKFTDIHTSKPVKLSRIRKIIFMRKISKVFLKL